MDYKIYKGYKMRKETKTWETICDGCGKVKEEPVAIAGHYDSGWRVYANKDLCFTCVHEVVDMMIRNKVVSEEEIEANVDTWMQINQGKMGYSSLGQTLHGGFGMVTNGENQILCGGDKD